MATTFEKAIQVLTEADVGFVVIGGFSAILHGSAHITLDLDVLFSRETDNVVRLVRALAPYHPRPEGFPEDLPFLWEAATLRSGTVFTLKTDLGRIDLMTEVSGLGSFAEVWEDSVEADLYGHRVRTLSLQDLIKAKRAAGLVKDLQVLPELESIQEALDQKRK